MEIPKQNDTTCNPEMEAVSKLNTGECQVSDLMEILDNDLFNPTDSQLTENVHLAGSQK